MTNKEHAEIVQQAVSDITEQASVVRAATYELQDSVRLWILVSCVLSASATALAWRLFGVFF